MNNDAVLDARDIAAEQAHARCTPESPCAECIDADEREKVRMTTCEHDGMKYPCIFGCDDEPECGICGHTAERDHEGKCQYKYVDVLTQKVDYCGCVCGPPADDDEPVLNDIDAVVEQVAQPRTFETLINEWTEACRAENNKLPNELAVVAAACPAILRLSALGMRLIYESNHMGMQQVMKMTKEKLSGL